MKGFLWYNDSDIQGDFMKLDARKMTLQILNEMDRTGQFSQVVLEKNLKSHQLSAEDRRLISQLLFGVLENKLKLDFYIRKLSAQRFSRIHPSIINTLRLGFYQLEFMDKIPDSAAVNESVKLAKAVSEKDAKFVNGILRNFIRMNKIVSLPDQSNHFVTYLSIKYSFPEWLVTFWINEYGADFTEKLLSSSNETPMLSIRTNTLKIEPKALLNAFTELGVVCEMSDLIPEGILIKDMNHLSINQLPGYDLGHFIIQDISSMHVGYLSEVKEGQMVIDVCAAPGGKSTHVAQLLNQTGRVLARDNQMDKLLRIEENAKRLDLINIETQGFDALEVDPEYENRADLVLVDAPCSGLGIIRRKPDIKYNKSPEDLNALVEVQSAILANASKYVKAGGLLIYSTCTLNRKENQDIVKAFLKDNQAFGLVPISNNGDTEGMLTLYPNVHGTDGFFIAKMKKIT